MEHTDQQAGHAGGGVGGEKWQVGLFDCFGDAGASLMGCCLPCVLHGRTMDRMEDPSLESHKAFNGECAIWCGIQCLTGFAWVFTMIRRGDIRQRYGIEGSACSDCCTSFCCLCCALVQQDREVALRAGHHAPVTEAYRGEKGMQMPPGPPAPAPQQQQQQGLQPAFAEGKPVAHGPQGPV
ncbi:hypothetical protein E4U42_006571 [Claviceps africana]|uniref:Uncharacterized protein n=1 Tax=Claviceps africana TaxID=83212 RepID=A0A8K0J268_9HYPO|nr:hypothetical protein E4U42_006571 [Claviceps africana]